MQAKQRGIKFFSLSLFFLCGFLSLWLKKMQDLARSSVSQRINHRDKKPQRKKREKENLSLFVFF